MADTEVELLRDALRLDGDLTTVATGSVWCDVLSDFPLSPANASIAATAYTTFGGVQVLKPTLVVSEDPQAPEPYGEGTQMFVRLGAYHPYDHRVTSQMLRLARAVLDDDGRGTVFGPMTDGRYVIVRWTGGPIRRATDPSIKSGQTLTDGVAYEADTYVVHTGHRAV